MVVQSDITKNNWHLIMPPILTLIDDGESASKIRGCELLQTLLQSTSSSLLAITGLGDVFTESLVPGLCYLPELTPEDESIDIQDASYSALFALTKRRFPDPKDRKSKNKVLDRMMRTGILSGLAHSGEFVKLATCLLKKLDLMTVEMGIWSAKHLKVSYRGTCLWLC